MGDVRGAPQGGLPSVLQAPHGSLPQSTQGQLPSEPTKSRKASQDQLRPVRTS